MGRIRNFRNKSEFPRNTQLLARTASFIDNPAPGGRQFRANKYAFFVFVVFFFLNPGFLFVRVSCFWGEIQDPPKQKHVIVGLTRVYFHPPVPSERQARLANTTDSG